MVLISSPEPVTREVTNLVTLGETVVAGIAELDSVPGLVAVENVVSVSVWETLGAVLGKVGLVSSGWVATEIVVFGFSGSANGKVSTCQCWRLERHGFDSSLRTIPLG